MSDYYPTTAKKAAEELRVRGCEADEEKLKNLIRNGHVTLPDLPNKTGKWTAEAIDTACDHLEEQGDLSPVSAFLATLGIGYPDYLTALLDAHDAAIDRYGVAALEVIPSASASCFEMGILPPWGDKPGRVWFTLHPEAEAKIKRLAKSRK